MDMTTEKPFACKSDGCGMSFINEDHLMVHEKKHEMMLSLSLGGTKSDNLFVADQTPTPTSLIKNCDEVGLFDDLRHVNPFDETFRRAVEQKSGQTPVDVPNIGRNPEEDSLHTPQVCLQPDTNDAAAVSYNCYASSLDKVSENNSAAVSLDVAVDDHLTPELTAWKSAVSRQNSNSSTGCGKLGRYRSITDKPPAMTTSRNTAQLIPIMQMPASIQFIQPQVITLSFPNNNCAQVPAGSRSATVIPVQTVKPFILPKLAAAPIAQPEPSSASLTPTSQLPIKERLKVILSNSSKSRIIELPAKHSRRRSHTSEAKCLVPCDDDFMERRRAASTRYRTKMRSVHEDLRRQNVELQKANEKLRKRVQALETELELQKSSVMFNAAHPQFLTTNVPTQIQIPASTVHLVMNIPKVIIPPSGQPQMQNPITFNVHKK